MAEEPKQPREIHIRINTAHLKKAVYLAIVVILVGVVLAQQFGIIPTSSRDSKETSDENKVIVKEIEQEEEKVTIAEEEPEEIIAEVKEEEIVEEIKEETIREEEETINLPAEGEIKITINKVSPVKKGEDYARIMSVEFTIANNKFDIIPTIKGYLTSDTEDTKEISLGKIEKGEIVTESSTKLTFGYNDIGTKHTLKLDLYNEKNKNLASTTYLFDTE